MFEPHVYHDSEKWHAFEGDELESFLKKVGAAIDDTYKVSPATTKVAWRDLPFYDDAHLIRLKDPCWGFDDLEVFYVAIQDKLFRLDGFYEPIKKINESASLKLSEDNVLDYLRFYNFFVRKEDFPFYVAEDISDPHLYAESLDRTSVITVENVIHPAICNGKDDKGNYLCGATVYYPGAVFDAVFSVDPTGEVSMVKDECLAADLKILLNVPLGKAGIDAIRKHAGQE